MNLLYYFFGTEGFILLKRGYLPFLSPSQLPDPWLQTNTTYQDQIRPQLDAADFRQHLKEQYQELPENLRSMISFEYFEQQSLTKREEIEQALLLKKHSQTIKPFACEAFSDWRVLSLYSQWHSAILWQQLGASGQGMVVEFEVSKSSFGSDSYNQHAQHFGNVEVVQHWQPFDDLYYVFHRPSYTGHAQDDIEWRLMRKLDAADRQIDVQGASRAMYKIPTKAVKRIILGYACSPEYCQQVKRYLSQDIFYRHCECVQAQLDPQTMRLQLVAI